MLVKEAVKEYVAGEGADVVGIAGVQDFPESYPPRPPQRIMPEAKSVVVFGLRMLKGVVGSGNMDIFTGESHTIYGELARIGYYTGRFLERAGYRAVVIPPEEPVEVSRETLGLVGDLSLKHAAVAAGLGVMGRSRLVLTPGFGPRVNFGAVVTDAPLTPDAPLTEELCADCRLCIDSCTVEAISEDMAVDTRKCVRHGGKYGLGSFIRYVSDLLPKSPEEIKEALRDPEFWNYYHRITIGGSYHCIDCLMACPVGE